MDEPPPNLVQHLKSKDYPQKAKGMSFFASVLSIFIYISLFYIFNLSPSSLVHNTKFLFLISNTLIFIIALDYGAFSSSKNYYYYNKHDMYEEYVMRRQQSDASFFLRPREIIKTYNVIHEENDAEDFNIDKRKNGHHHHHHRRINRVPDKRSIAIVPEIEQKKRSVSFQLPKKAESRRTRYFRRDNEGDHEKNMVPARKIQRSKSDIVKRVVFDESKNIIRRVETENYEGDLGDEEDKNECENEWANLSNEELNRRIEDFIQRINKQIRQQRDV